MYLQTAFYILGIIYMTLMILGMITVLFFGIYLKHRIEIMGKDLRYKIAQITAPASIATGIGAIILNRLSSMIRSKKK